MHFFIFCIFYITTLFCSLLNIVSFYSEESICQARASVMVYNNDIKKWEHAGGSQGISQVDVYHNHMNNNYRIVGRKADSNEVCFESFLFTFLFMFSYQVAIS